LGKNNYFEVGIIKRVIFETIFLHITNCTLQICLVYDECRNYGYYLTFYLNYGCDFVLTFYFYSSNLWCGQTSSTTLEYSWNPHPCFVFIMTKS
jgi:hypothetical protein